mgnify:CR=1 FL=1
MIDYLLLNALATLEALSVVIVRSLPPPAGGTTCPHLAAAGALGLSLEPVQSHEASEGPEVSPRNAEISRGLGQFGHPLVAGVVRLQEELLQSGHCVLQAHVALEALLHVQAAITPALNLALISDVGDAVVECKPQGLKATLKSIN